MDILGDAVLIAAKCPMNGMKIPVVQVPAKNKKYNQKERIRLLKLWSELFLNMKQRVHLSDISVTS